MNETGASGGTPPVAVEIRGTSKIFNPGRHNEVKALEDIDLHIDQGDFVTLIGPSGCGKSTLLRLIAALVDASDGTVLVNGKTADAARLDRDYSMVFQRAGLFEWRNVTRNIELPLELMGWKAAERRRRAAEMLELVKLTEFARHHPAELSGGMQQRIAIARAMSFHPQLLLMDEPFGALDEMTREHMQTELLRIWSETQITVVFVTHSIPEAVFLSTKVAVMSPRPGRIAALIDNDLGPRNDSTRDDPAFFANVTAVRDALRGRSLAVTAARTLLRSWLPPVVAAVVIFGGWEAVLAILRPDGFVLPPPSEIGSAVAENFDAILTATGVTGFIIVTGLIAGVVVGVTFALLVTAFRAANETLTPLAVAVNAVPIIALAPIFNAWFGILSPRSNQAVVVVLVFFPIFINTARGLTQVEPSQIELMESYGAGKWRIMREVRIPNAMPFFFTALKLATSLAVIAAIVAEYFGGRQDALGNLITNSAGLTRYNDAWAAVLAGSLVGIGLYALAVLIERLVMPWYFVARRSA